MFLEKMFLCILNVTILQKKEFPYNFFNENKRHFAKLPRFGSQTFNNNKIRVESQKIVGIFISSKKINRKVSRQKSS